MYMKKKIINGFLMVALLVASVGTFVSCKDYEEDKYSDLLGKNASLAELVEKYKSELDKSIADLKAAQEACRQMCEAKHAELDATIATLETKEHAHAEYERINGEIAALKAIDGQLTQRIIDAETKIQNLEAKDIELTNKINDLQTELTNVKATADAAKALAEANGLKITNLETAVTDLQTAVANLQTWTQTWQSTLESVAGIKAQADANKALIDSLIAAHKDCHDKFAAEDAKLGVRIDSIVNALEDFATKQELAEVAAQAKQYYDDAIAYTNLQIGAVNEKLNTLNATIAELEEAYKAADKELQDQIDAIKADVEALEERVAANEQAIANLTDALKKQITGIIIQATHNPVFGSFALPINLQSNVLAAYYGYAGSHGVAFPTMKPRYYVDQDNVLLTEKDLEMLGVAEQKLVEGGEIILGDEGNAGKVYLTINPNTVDFTGVELPIVNSIDENAGVKLGGLQKSYYKIMFGYDTRAENGFYEADATIAPENIEDVKLKVDFGALKEVAKDIVNGGGVDVSKVATTIGQQLSAFEMDANGVKASWTDAYGEHSVYSQYAIAATAIKPLSMGFGKDFNYTKVPGIDRIENLAATIIDKVNIDLPDFNIQLTELDIDTIDIVSLDEELVAKFKQIVTIDTTIVVKGQTVVIDAKDAYGNAINVEPVVIDDKLVEIIITREIDMTEQIKEIYGNVTDPIKDINVMLKDLKEYVADVNDLVDELNKIQDIEVSIDNIKGDLKAEISKYLDKFNSKFCNLINSTNKALRPVMLIKTADDFAKVSQAKKKPTRVNGTDFTLVATSYTAELMAPSFKKLVGVTNVIKDGKSAQDGDADCKAALDAANAGDLATVVDGSQIKFNASLQKGYVYEIVYTAVDYHGLVDAKKFYVTCE